MRKLNILLFCLAIFFVQGIATDLGFPKVIFKIFSESILFIFLFFNFSKITYKKHELKILFVLGLYILWVSISTLYNKEQIYYGLAYTRYTILGLMIFIVASNLNYTVKSSYFIFRSLLILTIVQIIASLINSNFLLSPLERKVGTMTSTGGTLGTVFTIFIAPFFLSYYLKTKKLYYLALFLGTLIIGVASGKRAVVFFYLLVSILVLLQQNRKKISILRIIIPVFFIIMGLNWAVLNVSSGVINGKYDSITENFGQAINYGVEYSSGYDYNENAIGRMAASENILNNSLKDVYLDKVIFGFGPSTLMGEMVFKPFNISYGIVGWGMDLISIGFPGVIIYCLLIFLIWKRVRRVPEIKHDLYHNVILVGTKFGFLSWIIAYVMYSGIFIKSPIPLFVFMFLCGFVIGNHRMRKNKMNVVKKIEIDVGK